MWANGLESMFLVRIQKIIIDHFWCQQRLKVWLTVRNAHQVVNDTCFKRLTLCHVWKGCKGQRGRWLTTRTDNQIDNNVNKTLLAWKHHTCDFSVVALNGHSSH